MPQLIVWKLEKIRVGEQARRHFDLTDLRALGANILEHGLLVPLLVRPDGALIAGERRLRAMKLVGMKECQIILTEKELGELFRASWAPWRTGFRDAGEPVRARRCPARTRWPTGTLPATPRCRRAPTFDRRPA